MANKFQVKRTSTSGVTPNTTNVANSAYIAPGEFAVNMADSKLFTANTSGGLLELGSNLTNLSVTNTINISTAFVANSSGITGTLLTASQPNITANNSTNFGGQPASYYTNASNISTGTLAFARLPALYLGTTAIQSTSAAQAVSGITTLAAGNTTITGFVNATSSVNSAVLAVGTNFVANTLGAYHTGTVNAASHTIGTTLVANTLGVYHTGTINAASHTVGTATVANSIGVFTTGTVNAATVSVGTNFITNTTLTTLGSNTVVNNNQQFRYQTVNTSAFAYFIHQNDDNFVFYTTNTAYGARPVWSIFANSITSAFTVSVPATFNGNVTLGTVAVSANGATGTAGQVLTTNGTSTYWATPTAAAVINVAAQYAWTNTHSFAANVSFSNNIGLATNTALYFNTTTDANWRLGRNTGATTKWTYTGNTIDIIAASSTGEGITFGLNGGNSYFETGYLGTYIASNATIGNSSIKTTINGTSFSGTANNSLYLGGTAAASYALLSGAAFTGAVSGITTLAAGNTNITGYINASSYGSFDYITTANNGNGTNIKIGDDAWFGDINTADTVSIRGQQSANNGYIVFGNADTTSKLGRAGTGALTYTGAFAVGTTLSAGNTTITGFVNATSYTTGDGGTGTSGGSTSNTSTYLVGNSSIFTTISVTGLFTSQGNGTFSIGNTTNRPAGFFNSVTGGSGSFTTLTSTATTTNVTASSFTTGSIVLGGTTQTGSILLGQSTANQTLSIANGATTSGNVKIVQIGTGGLSGSNTQITLGTTTGQSNVIVNANLAAFSANVSVASTLSTTDLTVSGNLTVSGTTTYINTTTLNVGDNIITLNADLTGATAPTENAGIEINRGSSANVQFLWDETNDRWTTNGQPLAISSLVATGGASGITTLAAGNTTITGFANVTSTIQGGAGLTIAGAASGITTLAAGNTTITGFVNATSVVNAGSFAVGTNFIANTIGITTTGYANVATTLAAGNTTVTGFANVTGSIQGGSTLTIAGAASGITTLAAGNTTITGFVNATSTIQGGAGLMIAGAASGITTLAAGNTTITGFANVISDSAVLRVGNATNFSTANTSGFYPVSNTLANALGSATQRWALNATTGSFAGAVSGITTLAAGNTTVTGFANVTGSIQGGSTLTIAGAASGITTLAAGNTTITGFVNATSVVNAGSFAVGTSFIANTVGITTTGYANVATTLAAGNTTVTGFVNATSVVNAAAHTIGSTFIANTTGIYHTGLVNAASYNVGTTFVANSTGVYTANVSATNLVLTGNLTVGGTTTTVSAQNLSVTDNMIYMNNGVDATITGLTANGTHIVFNAVNNFQAGWDVEVTGVNPSGYNATYSNILAANSTTFTVLSSTTGAYVSGGNARGRTDTNPDLGFAAGYNDGTYRHAGFFRDATDDYFKPFKGYLPEPDASPFIDTSNNSFTLAGIHTSDLRIGNTTVYATINSTTYSGQANNSTYLAGQLGSYYAANSQLANYALLSGATFTGAVSGITTLAAGNTTITGFANVTGSIQGGSTLTIAGAASGITTLAAGNTTITGFVNATSVVNAGSFAVGTTFIANTVGITTTGYANVATTLAAGNTTITGFANVISDSAVLRVGNATSFSTANTSGFYPVSNTLANALGSATQRWALNATTGSFAGAVSGITTLAAGNTTITGFANVTSTIQGGAGLTIAGALSGVTTAAMGNTTITGFANVTSTIQGGAGLTIAGAASGITTLAAGNTTITGFANVSTSVNSASFTVGSTVIANTSGVYAPIFYDVSNTSYYLDPASTGTALSAAGDLSGTRLFTGTTQARVKVSPWSSATYGMGMQTGYTFGGLVNDYAITFQMNNSSTRGFWWGDDGHTNAQGAMALTTDGKLTVATAARIGFGESDATVPGSTYALEVNGAFAATTKSFLIDHPTKEGMKLRYGSLEGPENGVYVRGRLTGSNTIELPGYWTGLVDEDTITVNLTPIGRHQKLYVEDIADNKVVVGNDNLLNKEINCFYTVFAERKDVEKLVVEY